MDAAPDPIGQLEVPAAQKEALNHSGPLPKLSRKPVRSYKRTIIDEYAFTRAELALALAIPVDPLSQIAVRDDGSSDFIVVEVHYSPR
jgi:hypothetical protein